MVDADEVVARAKVTPLAIAESVVREVEALLASAGPCIAVRGFEPTPVGAVVPATLTPRARGRFESVLREKLDWFGAPLVRLQPPVLQSGDVGGSGSFVRAFDVATLPAAAGQTLNFQAWFRDSSSGSASNFTDAIALTFCP